MAAVSKVGWKAVGVLSGVVAQKAARSLLSRGWQRTKGTEPPRNPASPTTTWAEALSWAAASGVAIGVSRMLASRGAAGAWRRATGHLPPGLEEVGP